MSHFLTPSMHPVPLIDHPPNGDKVKSTHICTLDLPKLPPGAQIAHIVPGLVLHSLLSIGIMCNAGCTVTFTKINCAIAYFGHIIICVHKCTRTSLWMVPITDSASNQVSSPALCHQLQRPPLQ